MPPLPPPNGTSTTAFFIVIQKESAFTSSISTFGWYRRPPLYGPRILLCCTRYPRNISVRPSSMTTGIETSRQRSRVSIRSMNAGGSLMCAAAARNCERARSQGLFCMCAILPYFLAFLPQIKQKLVREVQKALERRLDDEIQNKNEYVDGGKRARKPAARADDWHGKDAQDDGERSLFVDELPPARAVADAEREVGNQCEEEQEERDGNGV